MANGEDVPPTASHNYAKKGGAGERGGRKTAQLAQKKNAYPVRKIVLKDPFADEDGIGCYILSALLVRHFASMSGFVTA